MSFLPKMCLVFFLLLLLPLSPAQKSMSAFVRFNLASDDSKSLSVSGRAAVSGWHHFPSEQRARPVWTLGDTWGSNVAGHVSAGPLIRAADSQTCCGCRRPGEPQRAHKTEESTQGRWIEIKAQLLCHNTGPDISISRPERSFYSKKYLQHTTSRNIEKEGKEVSAHLNGHFSSYLVLFIHLVLVDQP